MLTTFSCIELLDTFSGGGLAALTPQSNRLTIPKFIDWPFIAIHANRNSNATFTINWIEWRWKNTFYRNRDRIKMLRIWSFLRGTIVSNNNNERKKKNQCPIYWLLAVNVSAHIYNLHCNERRFDFYWQHATLRWLFLSLIPTIDMTQVAL